MDWPDQVRPFVEQALAFVKRLANQANLGVFQITQASVDDACGTTGCASGKIILFEEQDTAVGAGTLASYSNSVDTAPDHDHLETLASNRASILLG